MVAHTNLPCSFSSAPRLAWIALAALSALVTFVLQPAVAQQQQQQPFVMGMGINPQAAHPYPSPSYFSAFNALNDGDYKNALDMFTRELRGAYRNGVYASANNAGSRWIDSICDYTMVAECQYRLGDYGAALENYEAALRIYMQFSDWMLHVQFPNALSAGRDTNATGRGAPWGKSTRGSRPAHFQETVPAAPPTTDPNVVVQKGGPLMAPILFKVNAQEVVRCTCLAMVRRQQILGTLVTRETLTDEVLAQASRRQGPPNHWSESWLDALQGTAYNVAGKSAQAIALLKRSLLMQGQYDHPLTGLALLQLGQISLDAGDFKTAAANFEEATYTGFDFSDAIVMEEAFRNLFLCHLLAGDAPTLDTPLSLAAGWARNKAREMYASIELLAVESLATRGQRQQAISVLADASAAIGRRTMANCEIGSRFNWLTALTQYQGGAIQAGDTALNSALQWYKNGGSKWLFQMARADNLCVTNPNGRFDRHVASPLYAQMLRDPTPTDWTVQPLESLAVLATPHPLPFEHWLEIALAQGTSQEASADAALVISDVARRHRFFSSQPFGGRMLALRWILEAPPETLDKQAKLQRQELLTRYPKYAEAADKVRQIRASIAQAGLSPESHEAQHALSLKFNDLASLSATQEEILHEMAVRREPANLIFPPVRKTKDVQSFLGTNKLLLTYFATSHALYGGFYSGDRSSTWKIDNTAQLEKRTTALLRSLGNFDANHEIPETQLTDESWKPLAKDLLASVVSNPKSVFNADFKELIIVPDGVLWYVPFDMLPLGDPKDNRPLISRMRVRYAPTVGLAISEREGRKNTLDYGVVAGRLFPNQQPAVAEAALEEIRHVATHIVALHAPLPAISPIVGSMLDGVLVLDEIPAMPGPYDWSPLPLEKTKGTGALSVWLGLPWKNPDAFIFPAFHTAAENSLKSAGSSPGNELFLATTGLMATGARTILISRWRTGGQTSVDLVREFVQELPNCTAAEAWQRAVELVSQSPLDPQREPRVKRKTDAPPANASNPFFWAGYLLVDSGTEVQQAEKPAEKPLVKFEQKKPEEQKRVDNKVPENKADDKQPPPVPKPEVQSDGKNSTS